MGSQDIWSLGCCVMEMCSGRRPWSNLDNEWAVMYHIASGQPPLPDNTQVSSQGLDFLKRCFVRDPNERPSATELLTHEWLRDIVEKTKKFEADSAGKTVPCGGTAVDMETGAYATF